MSAKCYSISVLISMCHIIFCMLFVSTDRFPLHQYCYFPIGVIAHLLLSLSLALSLSLSLPHSHSASLFYHFRTTVAYMQFDARKRSAHIYYSVRPRGPSPATGHSVGSSWETVLQGKSSYTLIHSFTHSYKWGLSYVTKLFIRM